MIKTCKNCGVEFDAKSEDKQFCSHGCELYFNHKTRIITCPVCGVKFMPTGKQQYCSKRCYKKIERQRQETKFND